MTLLLLFLAGMVAIGVCTDRLSWRVYTVLIGSVFTVTSLYYFTHRFMT